MADLCGKNRSQLEVHHFRRKKKIISSRYFKLSAGLYVSFTRGEDVMLGLRVHVCVGARLGLGGSRSADFSGSKVNLWDAVFWK